MRNRNGENVRETRDIVRKVDSDETEMEISKVKLKS